MHVQSLANCSFETHNALLPFADTSKKEILRKFVQACGKGKIFLNGLTLPMPPVPSISGSSTAGSNGLQEKTST
jgi:hypothetical protein